MARGPPSSSDTRCKPVSSIEAIKNYPATSTHEEKINLDQKTRQLEVCYAAKLPWLYLLEIIFFAYLGFIF